MQAPIPLYVLVVEDDVDARANLLDVLDLDGYRVATAGSASEALDRQDWATIDAIVLDRKLPDGSAEELLPKLRHLAPAAAIVIVTGYADLEGAIAAVRQGAADYLLKPVNVDLLRARLAGIAERKRAEQTIVQLNQDIQRRMADLATLLEVVPIGIAISEDPGCEFIRVNKSLARLLRLAPDANASLSAPVEQRPDFKVFQSGQELPAAMMPMQRAAAQGQEVRDVEFDVVFADGDAVTLFGHAAPLLDENGRGRGAVGAFLDITERKNAQERLLQTERLAAIGQMVTGLAHESGNALARSQVCLEMLAMEVEDRPEATDLVNRAQIAQNHLQQLYEEVRGYAAPIKLEREITGLVGVWRQAWAALELARKGRDACLREELGDIDVQCMIDSFRLQQVFRNILENALAACRDPVEITVTCSDVHLAGRPAVRIAVRDNGPGLTAEQQRRIFEPFFTTKTKGTGLGMAIAKRITEAHGGRITTASGQGQGAEIVLVLPREGS